MNRQLLHLFAGMAYLSLGLGCDSPPRERLDSKGKDSQRKEREAEQILGASVAGCTDIDYFYEPDDRGGYSAWLTFQASNDELQQIVDAVKARPMASIQPREPLGSAPSWANPIGRKFAWWPSGQPNGAEVFKGEVGSVGWYFLVSSNGTIFYHAMVVRWN